MRLVKYMAMASAVGFAVSVQAAEPKVGQPLRGKAATSALRTIADDVQPRGDACADVTVLSPALSSGGGSWSGDASTSTNVFECTGGFCGDCGYYGTGGADEIFQLQVDATGVWSFDTNTVPAGWDTSFLVGEDTGGGCPGDFFICEDDDGDVGAYESYLEVFLNAGTDYYFVVDDGGYGGPPGPFTVTYTLVLAACTSDAECSDFVNCNGSETCNLGTGQCEAGTPPCHPAAECVEGDPVECIDPDPCLRYQNVTAAPNWGSFPDVGFIADDWGIEPCGNILSYTVGAVGSVQPFTLYTALFDTERRCADTCINGVTPPYGHFCFDDADCEAYCCSGGANDGEECDPGSGDADCEASFCAGGYFDGEACVADADCPGVCSGFMYLCVTDTDCPVGETCDGMLPGTCTPDNGTCTETNGTCQYFNFPPEGDHRWVPAQFPIPGTSCGFTNLPSGYYLEIPCTLAAPVDITGMGGVWSILGFRDGAAGAGPTLAGALPTIGWSSDNFAKTHGADASAPGEWVMGWWFGGNNLANWNDSTLCCEPVGVCCTVGACVADVTEADCDGLGGTFHPGNVATSATCDDTDGDTVADLCDNCPGEANAGQEDMDGDGAGDVCDDDIDGDTVENGDDTDPMDPNVCEDTDADTCDDCAVAALPVPANDGLDTDGDGLCNDGDPDDDGDTVDDVDDAAPLDEFVCQDLDGDSCDDCSVEGAPNPANDGPDADGDGVCDATDNCVDDDNAGQEDFDGDTVGDACDNCPSVANPGQANADGDSAGDDCEECDNDPLKLVPGICGCGVADVGDADGDGVLDCVDECPGVDDALFAPGCAGAIPTVSEWGLVILALLLLAAAKVYFGRKPAMS